MIGKGEEWGRAATGPAEIVVPGGDAELAAALVARPGALVGLVPDAGSDVARAVGLPPGRAPVGSREVPMDALALTAAGSRTAVNAVVFGVAPDRARWPDRRASVRLEIDGRAEELQAWGVVILTGQYLRGCDLNPRSHPGDGVLEVQAYGLAPGQRRGMRSRLASGAHLPHPQITLRRGRRVVVRAGRLWPVEVDGHPSGTAREIEVEMLPGAYRLLL